MKKAQLFLSSAKKSPKIWNLLNKYTIKTVLVVVCFLWIALAFIGLQSPMVQGILESTQDKILIFGGVVVFALGYNIQKIGSLIQNNPALIEALLLDPKEYRQRVMDFTKKIMGGVGEGGVNQQSRDVMRTVAKLSVKSCFTFGVFYCLIGWSFLKLTEFHILVNIVFFVLLFISWIHKISMKSFEGAFEIHGLKN